MKKINLIGFDNKKGLSKDIQLLQSTLTELGYETHYIETYAKQKTPLPQKVYELAKARTIDQLRFHKKAEISLFIERIVPNLLGYSQVNLLMPNPEWFHSSWRLLASNIDAVLCKTHHAVEIYQKLGFKTHFTGFTSSNQALPEPCSKAPQVLHIAGGSHFKGTERLVKLWEKHPEWPHLTVVTYIVMANYQSSAHNVTMINQYLDHQDLVSMQNRTLFHAYPSQAEGFGHCINEAMSCGAIVLTTNAAPMNELVSPPAGFLIDAHVNGHQGLSDLVDFDEVAFEQVMATIIRLSDPELQSISMKAREAFDSRNQAFKENLLAALAPYA
jgi:glycosyltransferase involved in cell wall biosynthesis